MTKQTEAAIIAISALDETVTPEQIQDLVSFLRGRMPKVAPRPPCTRREAAEIIGCYPASITNYADAGKIRRVFGPASRRGSRGPSVRYNREDCERIASGVHANLATEKANENFQCDSVK